MNPEGVARPGSRSGARAATGAGPHWCRGPPVAAAPGLMRDGTGSGSWLCHPGCIRAVAGPGVGAAVTTPRDAARPDPARPRPRTRPTAQAARPACRPARSAPFYRRIRVDAGDRAMLAPARHHPGLAPRAAQRPRRRAILFALGRAGPFGQNALLRVSPIADPWSAPMAGPHGGAPVAVEAADPGGDGLGVPSSDLVGGRRVACAIRNGQERSGTLDVRGGSTERAAQAGQLLALIRRERAKRIFPVARHRTPRSTRITAPLYQFQGQMTH